MIALYNFGISQEDALTEYKALDLTDGDSLLCIASAGEIPLNLAAMADIRIVATDISVNQMRICRIKQKAAMNLDISTSASFLGYMEMKKETRVEVFRDEIEPCLTPDDRKFWIDNIEYIRKGVINSGKFEMYLQKISGFLNLFLGRRNLYNLFECSSIEEQKDVFERKIDGWIIKLFFRIAFHPWVYKNIGIDPAGLTHFDDLDASKFFYQRFRDFCCNTSSRHNYFLQYTLFKKILFPEALPEFLHPDHQERFSRNSGKIEYITTSINEFLDTADTGSFNRIHLSNICDWQSTEKISQLLNIIQKKTLPGTRIIMRYIYRNPLVSLSLNNLIPDYLMGRNLELSDRNPFFNIVPIIRN